MKVLNLVLKDYCAAFELLTLRLFHFSLEKEESEKTLTKLWSFSRHKCAFDHRKATG